MLSYSGLRVLELDYLAIYHSFMKPGRVMVTIYLLDMPSERSHHYSLCVGSFLNLI